MYTEVSMLASCEMTCCHIVATMLAANSWPTPKCHVWAWSGHASRAWHPGTWLKADGAYVGFGPGRVPLHSAPRSVRHQSCTVWYMPLHGLLTCSGLRPTDMTDTIAGESSEEQMALSLHQELPYGCPMFKARTHETHACSVALPWPIPTDSNHCDKHSSHFSILKSHLGLSQFDVHAWLSTCHLRTWLKNHCGTNQVGQLQVLCEELPKSQHHQVPLSNVPLERRLPKTCLGKCDLVEVEQKQSLSPTLVFSTYHGLHRHGNTLVSLSLAVLDVLRTLCVLVAHSGTIPRSFQVVRHAGCRPHWSHSSAICPESFWRWPWANSTE